MCSGTMTVEDEFLKPLAIDSKLVLELSRDMATTFEKLCKESEDQFLPTPISESIMRAGAGRKGGRFLAIDIGGTNLRVGFVELVPSSKEEKSLSEAIHNGLDTVVDDDEEEESTQTRQVNRHLEQSWPIQEYLKNENSDMLFEWIGSRIAEVVRNGCEVFSLKPTDELPMGITFSFPMEQRSLSEATLMFMGKGFAITSNLNLGVQLLKGYEKHRTPNLLPPIRIAAISNDAVSTLVSFIHQYPAKSHQRAVMGLIVGTGCNATIPLRLSSLGPVKRPGCVSVTPGVSADDVRIAVNTEWSINGSAPPLRRHNLITRWDKDLDRAGEVPGFQPLEYMTAGRYLGELARLMFIDYLSVARPQASLPEKLRQRFGLTTTFISHFYPGSPRGEILAQLEKEFPSAVGQFKWTDEEANMLYRISHAIEVRAAGIIAASTVALLKCAGDIPPPLPSSKTTDQTEATTTTKELAVGYTGGCIQFFQNYLADTQRFLDEIMGLEFGPRQQLPVRVVLAPCHDGGITGAGILVPAALGSSQVAGGVLGEGHDC
ncbi:hypothetical protein B0H66DRAFT_397920 [Apodospora peruviana]|uniref:Phosphotransferase n=1 Tax=Apodospora peruviana TaxID=516989 RepID=A0AAE0HT55_9PEZI|nr:hypothetical protein B0H66DRAFT_397920 [Apodospora peruviana]